MVMETRLGRDARNRLIGCRVKLIRCSDQYTTLPTGSMGTLRLIDDAGTWFVDWDSGSKLGLIPGEDRWEVLP